ncbi:MAG: DUF438 domain-containing protein [candidate division NC10 bacterium]|nr:DUF438 domain-containing protein [candidate division NC10 bacterium]
MSELINNREHRIQTMKEVIKHLHHGGSPEEVRGKLRTIVRETDASEIAAMEQQLMAEGMPVAEVQSMCDLHSSLLREILVQPAQPIIGPGHPVDTFRRENEALAQAAEKMRTVMREIGALPGDAPLGPLLGRWKQAYNETMDVEKHYQRKEHLLFSCLERHGITGPSKVMWGKDDEVRGLLKTLGEALSAGEADAAQWKLVVEAVAEPALLALEEMIQKEERILFPMSLNALTEDEWGEIWQQAPQYGYCLVEPQAGYKPPTPKSPDRLAKVASNESLIFPSGALTPEQLRGIFSILPVELTFTDADDRVRFFSEGLDRGFARSKAILGRKVQHCHPPKSVHTVEQILDDFKGGRQNVAEFWINFRGGMVHIRYFAIRGETGEYLGTLEVTQDITRIKALDGERRLLQYDSAEGKTA